jgi:hypothetical protein
MKKRTKYGVDFVPLRLTMDQKAAFQKWAKDNVADLGDYMVNLVGSGYKLSMNLDTNNDCYIVAITGTEENKLNRGLCITSRSDDLIEAVMMTVYKVVVLYDNGEWETPDDVSQDWG